MSKEFTLLESLAGAVDAPSSGILSKVVFSDEALRVTLFGFAAGEEMTDHATTMEALLHFVEGEAELTLGAEVFPVAAGAWVQMNPGLVHGIKAKSAVKMLLVLLRKTAS